MLHSLMPPKTDNGIIPSTAEMPEKIVPVMAQAAKPMSSVSHCLMGGTLSQPH
jgi:hypothetical protein